MYVVTRAEQQWHQWCNMLDWYVWFTEKVIVKHEDHILWVESLVLRNLGPVSRLYDIVIRRYIGIFFCWLGNSIYQTLLFFSHAVRCAPDMSTCMPSCFNAYCASAHAATDLPVLCSML